MTGGWKQKSGWIQNPPRLLCSFHFSLSISSICLSQSLACARLPYHWPTEWKGMLAPPDFGRVLSHDRFVRILRYLARGPDGTEHTKESDPWAEIRWMVDGVCNNVVEIRKILCTRYISFVQVLFPPKRNWKYFGDKWQKCTQLNRKTKSKGMKVKEKKVARSLRKKKLTCTFETLEGL